uniref:hypothetical protein n=1 Tax=Scandinavium goeteborgense TaxID=1851514 RepID=UPI0013580A06|nr:hypothetical protein [Scandinavium goeteborgense]
MSIKSLLTRIQRRFLPRCFSDWFRNERDNYRVRALVYPLQSGGWGADLVCRTGYAGRRRTLRSQMSRTFTSRREAIRTASEQANHLATLRYRFSAPASLSH